MSRDRTQFERQVAAHPFLLGMRDEQVHLLADCAMATRFETGHLIFRAGETANRFYLIERGRVLLESASDQLGAIVIDEVGDGGLLGWSWLFPPYVWHFDARAAEATSAIFFYGTILREYCEKDPTLGFELFKRMSAVMIRRLQSARTKLLDAMRHNRS